MVMYLLVGLGNPGSEYEKTYHNAGFIAIDAIAKHFGVKAFTSKFGAEVSDFSFGGNKIVIIKPQTYMNLSGKSVLQFKQFYKIDIQNIFVFHDEVDIGFGRIKIKTGGGSAGHNGLKSIDGLVGNDYNRVRIGIDSAEFGSKTSHVLSRMPDGKLDIILHKMDVICKNLDFLLAKQFSLVYSALLRVN